MYYRSIHIVLLVFSVLLISYGLGAQEKKRSWYEIQQEKVLALQEYKALEKMKDSVQKASGEDLTLSVSREPCDICAKWDIALYDKDRNYWAYYIVKFKKKNNAILSVMKLRTRKK